MAWYVRFWSVQFDQSIPKHMFSYFFHFVSVSKISILCQSEVIIMVTGSLPVTSQQGCLGAWALWPPSEGVGCGGVGHG